MDSVTDGRTGRRNDIIAAARDAAFPDGVPGDSAGTSSWRLNEAEVYDLLETAGLHVCGRAVLPSGADQGAREEWAAAAAELISSDGRLVMKILGRDILHKSDVGGVRIVDDAGGVDLLALADELIGDADAEDDAVEGVLATTFVPHAGGVPGAELLLSLRQDPAFGPVVVVGMGGVMTEWYGRGTGGHSRLILPARDLDADRVEAALVSHPLLSVFCRPTRLHGEPPVTAADLVAAVLALARLAESCGADASGPTLEEIEVNPVVASGGRLWAVDGVGLASMRRWDDRPRPLERVGNLLAPRSAVILGVSAKGANPGRIIMNNLRRSPGVEDGRLYVVHHREDRIDGIPCLPSLAALPEKVDLAVICVPAEAARDAIAELVEGARAESIILIPGGFAEAGHGDLAREIETILAEGHARPGQGPIMVGGNCLGIVSRDEYNTFFLPEYKLPFSEAEAGANLALVSQSGAYLVTFASNYDGVVNPRASISFGNQMDLTVSDFLIHFRDVAEVEVVACYVEGFRQGDGMRFLEAAREARSRGQRVIVFKAGKTELGAKAAASHTASLAGDYDVARSCLEDAGVVVAETLDEFEDLIKTFTMLSGDRIRGRRTGILSNAGFECSTVTDAIGSLELAPFGPAVREALDAALPGFAHRDNPVDATPMAGTAAYDASTKAIIGADEVDAAIISAVPVTPALDNLPAKPGVHREDLSGEGSQGASFVRILAASDKPAVVVVDSGVLYDPLARFVEKAGIPVFRKIDRAAQALARFIDAALEG